MRLFGLTGYPLSHSFSQRYFTDKFQKENIQDAAYALFPLENIEGFPSLVQSQPNLCGLNVTIPHKEAIIPYLDELDETAREIGAVNCVKIERMKGEVARGDKSDKGEVVKGAGEGAKEYRLIGYNTDAHGFRQSIKPFLEMHHERALILGTGGASKAVHYVLRQIGIDCYFVSRNPTPGDSKQFRYEDLNQFIIDAFPLIVNTTPLGMHPHIDTCPNIPYRYLTPRHLLYDLVYNPSETEFLKRGKAAGTVTINGLSMLYAQAEKAWEIWNE